APLGFSQLATSFIACPRLGIHHAPFRAWPVPFSPREKSRPAHTSQLLRRSFPSAHVSRARPSFPRTPVVNQLAPTRSGVDSKLSPRPPYGQVLRSPVRHSCPPASQHPELRRPRGPPYGHGRSATGPPSSAERHERTELGTGQPPWRGALAPRSSLDLPERRGRAAGVRPRRGPGPDRRRGAARHGAVEPGVDDRAADADVRGARDRAG